MLFRLLFSHKISISVGGDMIHNAVGQLLDKYNTTDHRLATIPVTNRPFGTFIIHILLSCVVIMMIDGPFICGDWRLVKGPKCNPMAMRRTLSCYNLFAPRREKLDRRQNLEQYNRSPLSSYHRYRSICCPPMVMAPSLRTRRRFIIFCFFPRFSPFLIILGQYSNL